jgi:hypothetical protein
MPAGLPNFGQGRKYISFESQAKQHLTLLRIPTRPPTNPFPPRLTKNEARKASKRSRHCFNSQHIYLLQHRLSLENQSEANPSSIVQGLSSTKGR